MYKYPPLHSGSVNGYLHLASEPRFDSICSVNRVKKVGKSDLDSDSSIRQKIMRFATRSCALLQDPAFCYKILRFATRSRVLLQKILRWVNERQMQTTKEKVDTSKALDASSVDTESNRTESKEHDISSRSGNDAHDDVADIKPIYDEESMAEVQTTAEINVFAIGQQHTEQPEFNNEGEVVQNVEECHDTCPLLAIVTDNQIPKHSYQSLESKNSCLKKTVAQFQKDFTRLEAHCVNLELKYQNQVLNKGQQSQFLKEKSKEAEVKHDIDVIETINIELEHKVPKLLKENESLKKNYKELFDSVKITRAKTTEHTYSLIATNDKFKAQLQEKGFAITALRNELRKSIGNSVNTKFAKSSILGKPMSQQHRNQSVVRQPTAFKFERPRISKPRSNDMVHNHYLEEAKKRTQEQSRNSEPSLIPSDRLQNIANGSKPIPRRNIQTSRIWPATKNSFVTIKTVPIAEHPRNSRNDSCVTKFLKDVNLRSKVPSNKRTNRNKPVEPISVPNKQERQIPKGHRWKPTGKIFKTIGLRWVPTGKIFASSTTKVDSEPLIGLNAYITNQYECKQTLDVSAGSNPSTNVQSTLAPSTHTNVHVEENNNDQAEEGEQLQDDEFTNPFCALAQEEAESSSHNIEAEYVALSASCAQVMWMRTQLQDYGFNYNKIPLYCDSRSAIAISCNPVQYSRTKHIHTWYHFIKEQVENGIIELNFVRTEYQLVDMFTKSLPEVRFKYLVSRIDGNPSRAIIKQALGRSYALSWKPCQEDSLNPPDHRSSLRLQVYQGRLLTSSLDDAKCEYGGQDTRLQGGKDNQDEKDKRFKDLKRKDEVEKQSQKAKDQRSRSMTEQAYNVDRDKD
nr:ribonuclease H [Tanacetum cinerariifolium]